FFFFSSRRRHTRFSRDWSSDVCSSDLFFLSIVCQCSLKETLKIFGCLYRRCSPLPIPNRAVKPARADGIAVTGGRVGRCLLLLKLSLSTIVLRLFLCSISKFSFHCAKLSPLGQHYIPLLRIQLA